MGGRCESNCGGDEVYLATFSDKEKTGLNWMDEDVSVKAV